ncbi:protein kinase domain-containing protein [Dactylosporangium sp. CA-233914]|uniref:serine/threonine-protein kinase n=1 Tax=Dactylosporangium sp. CA-233914 TaxID=3239934 RepID=UPI003D8E1D49
MQLLANGRYRLHEVLGRGGMATVWRADDLHLQRPVAVKVLSAAVLAVPGMRERLGREARILARLTHPNIVAVHDFDVESDTAYLVLELVEGPSLATLLRQGALPVVEQAVGIAIQVCDALTAAHAAGIQHRDIKPANIIVAPDGVAKVCDFGIARSDASTVNDPTANSGTSEYVAPERAVGDAGDARADLYALGCVLYAMLSGGPPFTGRTPVAVLRQHLHEVPVPLAELRADVPPELDRLVLDLLAKDPTRRPPSAEAVRNRLTALVPQAPATMPAIDLGNVPAIEAPATAVETTTRIPAAHRAVPTWPGLRWALVAFALLVLLGGILAVLPTLGGSPATPSVQADSSTAADAGAADDPSATAASPSADSPSPDASAPPTTPAPTATPGRPATLADQYNNLQAVIAQQVDAGQLDPKAGAELRDSLEEVARRLGKGQTDVTGRVNRVRQSLAGLVRNGKLTSGGYQEVSAALDRFASSLPRTQDA